MSLYTLIKTDNWAAPYIEYSPMAAGTGQEPMVSIGTMVRNTFLQPGLMFGWNRSENSSISTRAQVQDYIIPITDFGYLETASLTDSLGNTFQIKDVYNSLSLTKSSNSLDSCARPNAICVISSIPGVSLKVRFLSVPDQAYVINLTYQRAAVPFVSFPVTSAVTADAGLTVYNGTFNPASFNVGDPATIFGFKTNDVNNGTFVISSVTQSQLILANPGGISETISASAINSSWGPIPDYYSDIYNNLYLAEAMASSDDTRSQQYRQRGVAALLSKAEGLTAAQRNMFIQQMLNQGRESQSVVLKLQQATQGSGV